MHLPDTMMLSELRRTRRDARLIAWLRSVRPVDPHLSASSARVTGRPVLSCSNGLGGGMPTVLRWRGWNFLFYSADWREPPHVHVRKGRQEVKFWLDDCSVAAVRRVPEHELNMLREKVREQCEAFLERWHEHFG